MSNSLLTSIGRIQAKRITLLSEIAEIERGLALRFDESRQQTQWALLQRKNDELQSLMHEVQTKFLRRPPSWPDNAANSVDGLSDSMSDLSVSAQSLGPRAPLAHSSPHQQNNHPQRAQPPRHEYQSFSDLDVPSQNQRAQPQMQRSQAPAPSPRVQRPQPSGRRPSTSSISSISIDHQKILIDAQATENDPQIANNNFPAQFEVVGLMGCLVGKRVQLGRNEDDYVNLNAMGLSSNCAVLHDPTKNLYKLSTLTRVTVQERQRNRLRISHVFDVEESAKVVQKKCHGWISEVSHGCLLTCPVDPYETPRSPPPKSGFDSPGAGSVRSVATDASESPPLQKGVSPLDLKVQKFVDDAQNLFATHGRVIESQFLFKFKQGVGYLPKVKEYGKNSLADLLDEIPGLTRKKEGGKCNVYIDATKAKLQKEEEGHRAKKKNTKSRSTAPRPNSANSDSPISGGTGSRKGTLPQLVQQRLLMMFTPRPSYTKEKGLRPYQILKDDFLPMYRREYNEDLSPRSFGFKSTDDMIQKTFGYGIVVENGRTIYVWENERDQVSHANGDEGLVEDVANTLRGNTLRLFRDNQWISSLDVEQRYFDSYGGAMPLASLDVSVLEYLDSLPQLEFALDNGVRFYQRVKKARRKLDDRQHQNILRVFEEHAWNIKSSDFERLYEKTHDAKLDYRGQGFSRLVDVFDQIPSVIVEEGVKGEKFLVRDSAHLPDTPWQSAARSNTQHDLAYQY